MEIGNGFGTILGLIVFVLIFIFIRWISNETKKFNKKKMKFSPIIFNRGTFCVSIISV